MNKIHEYLNNVSLEIVDKEPVENNTIKRVCLSNVVSEDTMRRVQIETLDKLRDYISKTFGPMASNTQIITGNNKDTILSNYSKDGLKVLKNIQFSEPLEMAIQSEVVDIAANVEKKVGDGTTSSVILSSFIFRGLYNLEKKYTVPPRRLVKYFNEIIEDLQKDILKRGKEITLEDVYKICMISTNGDEDVSNQIVSIYKEYGFDVDIDVGISNDQDSKIKIYDGITLNEGYSDPAYINNMITNTADIHNPRIYAFSDPIDTPEMVSFLEKILVENIFNAVSEDSEVIPTVIITPHITRDASGLLTKLVSILYEYNKQNSQNQKPPVLIITNISGTDEEIYDDIAKLCHCKYIRKYIDAETQKSEQEKGNAPTIDNVVDFYGTAEFVSADSDKVKFINPAAMIDPEDKTYSMLVNFLKQEIESCIANNDDHLTIGRLKKRLRCIEGNMIEYLIGGITVADRDSKKDLVEDAIKNVSSAAVMGVGKAANFEGLYSSYKELEKLEQNGIKDGIYFDIACVIFKAYYKAAEILYRSAVSEVIDMENLIDDSIENECPWDVIDLLNNDEPSSKGENVLCSINTDVEILGTIARLVTLMVTANQCLLQAPMLNKY